jgi:hypothetical protein
VFSIVKCCEKRSLTINIWDESVTIFLFFQRRKQAVKHKKWMIVVYLAGDNNLSEEMSGTFKDFGNLLWSFIRKPEDEIDIAVMVYFDGSNPNTPTFYCDYTNQDKIEIKTVKKVILPTQDQLVVS